MNDLIPKVMNLRWYLRCLLSDFWKRFNNINNPAAAFALDGVTPQNSNAGLTSILQDIIGDGFLYAAPKKRRTIERRLTRRLGTGKILIPKKNLVNCNVCGHFHPVHAVCANCYERIKEETQIMQRAIIEKLKLKPIDKEVIVLYKDDPRPQVSMEGKQIVELPKERPPWFSKNLLAKDSGTRIESTKSVDIPQPKLVVKE